MPTETYQSIILYSTTYILMTCMVKGNSMVFMFITTQPYNSPPLTLTLQFSPCMSRAAVLCPTLVPLMLTKQV